jgi:molecular chaperone GrpE
MAPRPPAQYRVVSDGSPINADTADASAAADPAPGSDLPADGGSRGKGKAGATNAEAAAMLAVHQAEIERLAGELEAAQAQTAEHLTTLQRTAAEFSNYRRRTQEEREREAGLASEYLLRKVLSIADDLDRAVDARPADLAENSWVEGITAIDRKLRGLIESEGVTPIEAVGRQFDPREHEAIANVPATGRPDGEVVAEVQRGYRIRDRVLRPALVAVAANTEPSAHGGGPDGNASERAN